MTAPPVNAFLGVLVAVEGIDGAGKDTQLGLLAAALEEDGYQVTRTFEPGHTIAGQWIRDFLLDGPDVNPATEALLYAADRAEHVHDVVLPALRAGRIVLTNRFAASSLAYQGHGRGLNLTGLTGLSRFASCDDTNPYGIAPALTILLDLDPAVARARANPGREPDRIERANLDFHQRVRAGFLDLAMDPVRRTPREDWLVLSAEMPVDEIHRAVYGRVTRLLAQSTVRRNPVGSFS